MVEDEEEEPKEEKGEVVQMAQKSIVGAFGTKFLMIQSFVGANHLCIWQSTSTIFHILNATMITKFVIFHDAI